jgi:hypothetical protein
MAASPGLAGEEDPAEEPALSTMLTGLPGLGYTWAGLLPACGCLGSIGVMMPALSSSAAAVARHRSSR